MCLAFLACDDNTELAELRISIGAPTVDSRMDRKMAFMLIAIYRILVWLR